MATMVRKEPASLYASVGIDDDVDIRLDYCGVAADSARIKFGREAELVLEFMDAESLDRLAALASEGAVGLRERSAAELDEAG